MAELFMDGYITGQEDCKREIIRIASRTGDAKAADFEEKANAGNLFVSAMRRRQILGAAQIKGGIWVGDIEKDCKRVLEDALAAHVLNQPIPQKQVAKALRAVVESHIETPETLAAPKKAKAVTTSSADKWRLKQARKKVWEREYKQWQDYKAGKIKATPAIIKARQAATRMRTGHNRWLNNGRVARADANPEVVYMQFTLGKADKHTDVCLSRAGWVVRKGDPRIAANTPPLHWDCRSRWVPVTRAAAKQYKIKRHTPRAFKKHEPAVGFGGVGK